MDFEKHFDFIDSLSQDECKKNMNCCSLQENIQNEQGMKKCKVCSNIISNIVDNIKRTARIFKSSVVIY